MYYSLNNGKLWDEAVERANQDTYRKYRETQRACPYYQMNFQCADEKERICGGRFCPLRHGHHAPLDSPRSDRSPSSKTEGIKD